MTSQSRIEPISPYPHEAVRRPVIRQWWLDLTFLHWRYEPSAIRPLVPQALELDIYDGAAWLGLVPFRIEGLTHPRAPALPWLSNFPETNVRTYVIDRHGRRGVWFFSLDAARLAAVIGARAAYALPYFWASMRVDRDARSVRYCSKRRAGPPAHCDIEVDIGPPIPNPSELEVFLTARFRLYAERGGRLLQALVEHPPWPLQRASVGRRDETMVRAAGLPDPSDEPLAHFANRVDVITGWPEAV